ncbi:MAG: CHAD domain-containing protein [Archangium sp.]|nr:CHAD domain-containing protein [Archangium sp.]
MISNVPWLKKFERARVSALQGDLRGLHDVRTSARRLRVWLRLAGLRVLEDDLKWLCRETSELRDLDVFGDVLTEAARLQLRPAAQKQAYAALKSRRIDGVVFALKTLQACDEHDARAVLNELERELARTKWKLNDDAIHAYRRKIRRVRYAREWLGLDAQQYAWAQEVLGTVCDVIALEQLVAGR